MEVGAIVDRMMQFMTAGKDEDWDDTHGVPSSFVSRGAEGIS